ncbi:polyketide cyclase / dehydrase [Aureococcus anophagefferens]|nr:polyketide cyclase / dehydrase [Aureococcus anophagefferens]
MHAISALLLLAGPGAALIAQRPAPRQRHCNTLAATTADKKATRETCRQIKARKKASPTSLGDDLCLIPGEVVVRVDAAPGNARRIYTGVDISADVDTVWDLLTDYEGLADVVPNLVANEVIAKPPGGGGALRQVGSAQVLPGVNFKASMVLDVAENRIAGDLVKNLEAVAVEAAVRYRDAAEKRAARPTPPPATRPTTPRQRRRDARASARGRGPAAVQADPTNGDGRRRRQGGLSPPSRVSDAGSGAREDADRAAAAPSAPRRRRWTPRARASPGGGLQPAIFDAKRFAGAWAVALVAGRGDDDAGRDAAGGGAVPAPRAAAGRAAAAPRSPRRSRGAKPVTEVDVATSAFRLFPRTTETPPLRSSPWTWTCGRGPTATPWTRS